MPRLYIDAPDAAASTIAQLASLLGYERSGATEADATLSLNGSILQLCAHNSVQSIALPISLPALAVLLQGTLTTHTRPLPGNWQFDPARRSCTHTGHAPITLTDKESLLLATLLSAQTPLTRDSLTRDIWAHETGVDSHTLETTLYRLRQKLEPIEGLQIRAESGGYAITPS